MSWYPITPAATFPNHPEWPVYEAPARWYIQQGEGFGKRHTTSTEQVAA
jgi:hypothetical protein